MGEDPKGGSVKIVGSGTLTAIGGPLGCGIGTIYSVLKIVRL